MEPIIWLWLGIFVVGTIFELATVDFVAIWFAIASIPAFILGLIGAEIWLQFTIFVLFTFGFLAFTRPYVMKYFKTNQIKTNVDAMIGKIATATSSINEQNNGTVKLKGVTWSAASQESIKEGDSVRVLEIEGNKLIVEKIKKNKGDD
jgi:membrane protein implicated in regulation of membrane protease activity